MFLVFSSIQVAAFLPQDESVARLNEEIKQEIVEA